MDITKIKGIFQLYDYICLEETDQYLVFAVSHSMYPGIELISLIDPESKIITEKKNNYGSAGYAVRVCPPNEIDAIEDYLFNWFFQVAQTNNKINIKYKEYSNKVLKSYGLANKVTNKYQYIECPYTIERYNVQDILIESGSQQIVDSIKKELEKKGPSLIIVEAAAGFGKTSTAMELLNSYASLKQNVRPFYMQLEHDRNASTFHYLFLSQVHRDFDVLLGDKIVLYNIKQGRIPLILDGFDELLSEDLDIGNILKASKKEETMLSTIVDLLVGNTKIVLTTRKTAFLSGDAFVDWYQQKLGRKGIINVVRYRLDIPRIEDWLKEKRIAMLSLQAKEISSPVLLGYLRYMTDKDFFKECKSDDIVERYINRLLNREKQRQDLPFSVLEQKLIFARLASLYAYDNITSDTRSNVKDLILLTSEDLISKNEEGLRDSISIANTLTNHALLDRKTNNNIGFINDFIFGLFLGYALIQEDDKTLRSWYSKTKESFIEKIVISYSSSTKANRESIWIELNDNPDFDFSPSLIFMSDVKLLGKIYHSYQNWQFEGYYIVMDVFGEKDFSFTNCMFVNFIFDSTTLDFNFITNCTFINCSFNNCLFDGNFEVCDFYSCTKDGTVLNNEKEDYFELDVSQTQIPIESLWVEMLSKYLLKGGKGRQMRPISRIRQDYDNGKQFKKIFNQLCRKKYILTNGDKSHLSDEGYEFLISHK